ncbi:porin [Sphingomonas sabuli]|uniref:Porin n=1 Tax=Sphingomonas sabuli TaxID=2764186 RepID=A0A7G9L0D8_9SPHN|nr:porin [Sphingomonas sabuli]QNM82087.1 porin [Sphingomonas sabuli]
MAGKIAVALGAAGILLTPALAVGKKRPPAVKVSLNPQFDFTPSSADPRLAAAFSGRTMSPSGFEFTPAASKGRPSQIRVAIRARSAATQQAAATGSASPVTALAPVSYNLGAAVGWRRFAVSGDVAKVNSAGSPVDSRESATVGVSYSLPRFTGRVAVSADRSEGTAAPALRQPDQYAVDVGGSYALTKRISVTGGVRYKVERDRIPAIKDDRVDSQAVYLGTAFKF